jgi:uncharacterized protein with ParB-like and HNH nuclease domain
MANKQLTIEKFFIGKILNIPEYQRSYAWEKQNVRDLIEDINESLETNSSHYIGTVVLAKTTTQDNYNIVDGQQRLTTILMMMNVLILRLTDKEDVDYYKRLYIFDKNYDKYKLTPLDRDANYFFALLQENEKDEPKSRSQRYLTEVYEEIKNAVEDIIINKKQFLRAIENLQILEFIEDDEGDAIRIFQTVNDRGKELTRMDKIKSLLFYFSNKYLDKKYDHIVNETFGEIFELYDNIKLTGEKLGINIIASKLFNEDDILRYHHITFSNESYDPTVSQVMDNVKSKLMTFRKNKQFDKLEIYLNSYLESLLKFTTAFNTVINKTKTDNKYYKIFKILGISAVYYPIVMQLEKLELLDEFLPNKNIKIIDMIEIIDVRVLKIREYAGKKKIGEVAWSLNNQEWSITEIEEHLLWFNSFEINNERFKSDLSSRSYYGNTGLLRLLFIDYNERLTGNEYSIEELKDIMRINPTIEHILSQTPKFTPKSFGFRDEDEFEEFEGIIGNLTILEKSINSSIQNKDLVEKIKGYDKSIFLMTKKLSTKISLSKVFNKSDLDNRTNELIADFVKRWWA